MERLDAIYARQSIDKADSISIESQIEFCRYETRGAPALEYCDKGYSGKNTDRPGFKEMCSDIFAGKIKRVICYKLDRCSRSILDFATLMEQLQDHNVEFVSCTERFDTSTPIGRAMLSICIVFAQLERETIQQRVRDAYYARSKKGFYMGGRIPFGFRLEPFILSGKKTSRYVPNPEEADILKRIYTAYARQDTSFADICRMLELSNIRNPRNADGHWDRTHLGRMLYNPIYVKADYDILCYYQHRGVTVINDPSDFIGTNGCYLFTDRNKLEGNKEPAQKKLVLAPHEGIVSSALWLQCRLKSHSFRGL